MQKSKGDKMAPRVCGTVYCTSILYAQYTAVSRKVVRRNAHATIPKVTWELINTLFVTTEAVEPTFVAFL